jgi:MarC family membrane protein
MTILSAALLLILVMDPVGNIPLFLHILKEIPAPERRRIIVREHLIALLLLVVFLVTGRYLLEIFQIEQHALGIAGGIILFLIALQMIFARPGSIFGPTPDGEPFIVPLAVPFIAGPSTLTTVLLLASREPKRWPEWLLAIGIAWLASMLILLLGTALSRVLGERLLGALERLMGMILTAVAVQMFLTGVRAFTNP